MGRIDLGIDQCDEDLVAAGEAMRIGELELLRRVLSAVDGLLLLVLRQGEEVIGLSARDQPLARCRRCESSPPPMRRY